VNRTRVLMHFVSVFVCLDRCPAWSANVVLMNNNVVETLGYARSLVTRLMSHLCSFAIVGGMCSHVLSLQIHPAWNW